LGAKNDSSLSPSFLNRFFCFFGCSGMGVGLQKLAFLSHTKKKSLFIGFFCFLAVLVRGITARRWQSSLAPG